MKHYAPGENTNATFFGMTIELNKQIDKLYEITKPAKNYALAIVDFFLHFLKKSL